MDDGDFRNLGREQRPFEIMGLKYSHWGRASGLANR